MGVGVGCFTPNGFGQRNLHDLREFIAYRPGPSLEGFTSFYRLDEALAPRRELDYRTSVCQQTMREQTQGLDGRYPRITLSKRGTQHLTGLFVSIKKHILFAGKVIEHRHPPDIGSRCDLIHRNVVKSSFNKEACGRIGDGLPSGEALAGPAVSGTLTCCHCTWYSRCTQYIYRLIITGRFRRGPDRAARLPPATCRTRAIPATSTHRQA